MAAGKYTCQYVAAPQATLLLLCPTLAATFLYLKAELSAGYGCLQGHNLCSLHSRPPQPGNVIRWKGDKLFLEVQSDQVIQAKQAMNTQSITTTDNACKCSIHLLLHLPGTTTV